MNNSLKNIMKYCDMNRSIDSPDSTRYQLSSTINNISCDGKVGECCGGCTVLYNYMLLAIILWAEYAVSW